MRYLRLDEKIKPEQYNIDLNVNMKDFSFYGDEEIKLSIDGAVEEIRLNSLGLNIENASIEYKNKIIKAEIENLTNQQQIALSIGQKIKNKAILHISFSGKANDDLAGLYISEYKDSKGSTQYLLSTQLEPADARRVIPCFDEPSFKSVFNLSVTVDKEFEVISNSPVKSIKAISNKKRFVFKPTPKMSTYLLYIGIGRFFRRSKTADGIKYSVVYTEGKDSLTELPLRYAIDFVRFYIKYFKIKYPLEKLDLLAIPDFPVGAMENWGAITFRESRFLVNESSSITDRFGSAEVVAHELAHQWFGDLVTMRWWDDLWLNESFATFMSYKAIENAGSYYKQFDVDKLKRMEILEEALNYDVLKTTHPINARVETPEELSSLFDTVTYEKGASFLMMLEQFVGEDVFRNAISSYLNKYKYSNASKDDLWNMINNVSKNRDVIKFAKAWLEKEGYPVISISKSKGRYKLEQKRFVLSKYMRSEPWPINIEYLEKKGKELKKKQELVTSKEHYIDSKSDYIKLNASFNYLYVTDYPDSMLNLIVKEIEKLSDLDKAELLEDIKLLFMADRISIDELLRYYDNAFHKSIKDSSIYTLNTIVANLRILYETFYDTKKAEHIKESLSSYVDLLYNKFGVMPDKEDTMIMKLLKNNIIVAGAYSKHSKIINYIEKEFKNILNGRFENKDSKGAILKAAALNASKDTAAKIKKLYEEEINPTEKATYLRALAYAAKDNDLDIYLRYMESENVRKQDRFIMFANLSLNVNIKKSSLLKWLISKWDYLKEEYPPGTNILQRYTQSLSNIVDSKKDLELVKEKIGNSLRDDTKKDYNRSIEMIEQILKLRKEMN
ncbi:MAG: leucyl aminopeptidase [Candidatus Micrarchaeota archaeon]|nr:MAG: leucyl aminopeptidase [Candidatus Micrarchaeota archaeon]